MNAKTGEKHKYEIENIEDSLQLKQIYGLDHDWDDIKRIRLFYMGKEIEDDICIAAYDIHPDVYIWGLVMDEE